MTKSNAGSKADGVNFTEIRENALGSLGGGEPVSIRKRGYHRALKSRKQWTIQKQAYRGIMQSLCNQFYADYVYEDNPLLKLSGLSSWLPVKGTTAIEFGLNPGYIPIIYAPRPTSSLWSHIKSWFQSWLRP